MELELFRLFWGVWVVALLALIVVRRRRRREYGNAEETRRYLQEVRQRLQE